MGDDHEIRILDAIEHVRARSGMYVGSCDAAGLEHLLWEVVGNALDEHLARRATWLRVRIDADEVSVEDDGAGIPLGPWPGTQTPAPEVFLTQLHPGWGKRPHVHVGRSMLGVGLCVTNALAARLSVEVRRDGRCYAQHFAVGRPLGPLLDVGPALRSGTCIRFTPDRSVFGTAAFERERIAERLRELAFLNPGLMVAFEHDAYFAPDGSVDHVDYLARMLPRLHTQPIVCRGVHEDVEADVALLWTASESTAVHGFVSSFATRTGTHIDGFWAASAAAQGACSSDPSTTDNEKRGQARPPPAPRGSLACTEPARSPSWTTTSSPGSSVSAEHVELALGLYYDRQLTEHVLCVADIPDDINVSPCRRARDRTAPDRRASATSSPRRRHAAVMASR